MVLVPDTVDPVVDTDATVFANGSLSNHELTPDDVCANDAPVDDVGSTNHAVANVPDASYSPIRIGKLDKSSHAHDASNSPSTVRDVRLPDASWVNPTVEPSASSKEITSSVRSVVKTCVPIGVVEVANAPFRDHVLVTAGSPATDSVSNWYAASYVYRATDGAKEVCDPARKQLPAGVFA